MDWLIAFLNKTPAELTVGEAGIMLLVLCLAGIGICVIFLKALSPRGMELPRPKEGERNPFLTEDGHLKPGHIQKNPPKVV